MSIRTTAFAAAASAFVSLSAFAETWDHWEFGSEVDSVWTKGAVDAKGMGELRDGNWRIRAGVENDGSGRDNLLAVKSATGAWISATNAAHLVILDGTGTMDLRKPIYGADDKRFVIYRIDQTAFRFWNGHDACSEGRKLESFFAPLEVEEIGWGALGGNCPSKDSKVQDEYLTLTNVVLYVPHCRKIGNSPLSAVRTVKGGFQLYAPRCKEVGEHLLRNSDYATCAFALSAQDFSFDRVETLDHDCFYGLYSGLSGSLRVPSVKKFGRSQFYQDSAVTGLVIGSDDPQLAQLGLIGLNDYESYKADKWNTYSVFCRNGLANAQYLVIGNGTAETKIGRLAFDRTAGEWDETRRTMIPRIYFTGVKPQIGFAAFYNRMEVNPKTSVFVIRKGMSGWDTIVAAAKANSTADDESAFASKFGDNNLTYIGVVPTDPVYSGVDDIFNAVSGSVTTVTASTYFGNSAPQYLAYGNWRTEVNDVDVRNVLPDGKYLVSEDLLGFWTEKDLALNESRTVTVPERISSDDGNTYACEGYTIETSTADGWSEPTALVAGTNYVHTQTAKGCTRVSFKWRLVGTSFDSSVTWAVADDKWTATSGDAISDSIVGAKDEFGNYPLDAERVLTPTFTAWTEADGLPKWGFSHWEGNLDGCTVDADGKLHVPVTIASRKFVARFRHDWLWESDAKTLWNRVFRFKASVKSAADRTLTIGSGKSDTWIKDATWDGKSLPTNVYEMANRPLDLAQPITDASGAEFTIVEMKTRALSPWTTYTNYRGRDTDKRLANYPSQVVFPKTLTSLGKSVLQNDLGWDGTPLTSVILDCPLLTGKLADSLFYGYYLLAELVVKVPNVTSLGINWFSGCTDSRGQLCKTDLSTWDLSSVETISSASFYVSGNVASKATGTLKLPKLKAVPANAFYQMCGMTGIEIGGSRPRVESIGEGAFSNCVALASMTIANEKPLAVGANAFYNTPALKEFHFVGETPAAASVDAMLLSRTASDPSDYAVIYGASANGWRDAAAPLDSSLGETAPDGTDCFGVWRAGLRKAYLVNWPKSPWKLRGTVIFVR